MSAAPHSLTRAAMAALTHATGPASASAIDGAFTAVSSIDRATPATVVFAQDDATLDRALASPAGVILASATLRSEAPHPDPRLLWVNDARLAFSLVARALRPAPAASHIHPTAVVASSALLGQRVQLGPGVVVGEDVRLGDDVHLEARVIVHAGTDLGARVHVRAGTVLGGAGFGWVRDRASGEYVPFPQQGRLLIEHDVSVGANCNIDRGALDDTRIGTGTKIDSLVHIAHSCRIGCRVIIAAQTGIAGSSIVGDDAVIAGQVGIADHVEIGPGVVLGAKCGVPSHKVVRGPGEVFWGIPARPIGQYLRELARLRRGL